ncbi:unnamed protein product [Darwinula stevensoni]|uniref:Uncharacterized protein n=1 Tax=Darwinula stevensoni TaxID=69355 RepID=A0A7R8XGP1_9CRUS|nr:unnamed protein product [Darwinula stevensoni]CAG0891882.1 unnamed protein product [Darwinula stevensoni]
MASRSKMKMTFVLLYSYLHRSLHQHISGSAGEERFLGPCLHHPKVSDSSNCPGAKGAHEPFPFSSHRSLSLAEQHHSVGLAADLTEEWRRSHPLPDTSHLFELIFVLSFKFVEGSRDGEGSPGPETSSYFSSPASKKLYNQVMEEDFNPPLEDSSMKTSPSRKVLQ